MMRPSPNGLRACAAAIFPLAGIIFFGIGKAESAAENKTGEVEILLQPRTPPLVRDIGWRRVGPELTALHEQFMDHRRTGSTEPFSPGIEALQVADDNVLIDAAADGDVDLLVGFLEDLGAVGITKFKHVVSAKLPLASIPKLSDITTLRFARPAAAIRRAGLTTTQGDAALNTDLARQLFDVDGSGVTVGVMSDSFDCLGGAADGVASDDLPQNIVILDDSMCPNSDEARAMAEIIHDIAPGALINVHTAFGGQADFALGIQELAGCPPGSEVNCSAVLTSTATVIVDDVGYFSEPFFEDGIIAQAVDVVFANGVSYFSAAGNSASVSYEAPYIAASGPFTASIPHDFDAGPGADALQKVTVPVGNGIPFVLQWDSPYFSISGPPGSPNDMNICVWSEPPGANPIGCTTTDSTGGDPIQFLSLNVTGAPATVNFSLEHVSGPAPSYLKWNGFRSSISIEEWDTASSTIVGHPNAEGAVAVGAAFYIETPRFDVDPALLEPFSSTGGTPIFTDTVVIRNKPEIVAPDGGNTTFFGTDFEPDNFPNFFGTSASAPHAAGVAALMRSTSITETNLISPSGIRDVMESSAMDQDMESQGFDYSSGFGLLNGKTAVGALDPSSAMNAPTVLILDGGPPGGGTFNALEELQISTVMTNTSVLRSPKFTLMNGAAIDNATFKSSP